MLKTWLCAGVLSLGVLAGCDDGNHDDGDLTGSGDNLKGRDKDKKDAAPTPKDVEAPPADAAPTPTDAAAPELSACAALLCPADTQCVVKQVQCIRAPCPPIASCEPIATKPTCAVTLCKQGSTCVEGPNGAECIDQTGAGTCAVTLCAQGSTCVEGPSGAECVEQKCTAKCSAGQHCELQEVQCIKAPCYPVPTCVDDVTDPCATVKCTANTHCETTQPQCFTTPCPPITGCVPN